MSDPDDYVPFTESEDVAWCNPENAHDGPCGEKDCWWPDLFHGEATDV